MGAENHESYEKVFERWSRDINNPNLWFTTDNIKEINGKDGKPIGVIVEFHDGDIQKAIVQHGDTYNYETGVIICTFKHFIIKACHTKGKYGTYWYNKIIREVFRTFKDNQIVRAKFEEEKETVRRRRKKRAEKKQKRKERRLRNLAKMISEEIFSTIPMTF